MGALDRVKAGGDAAATRMSLATTLSSAAASEPAEADATTVVGRVAGDTLEGTPAVTIEGVTKTFDAARARRCPGR